MAENYDFSTVVDRTGTGSCKWELMLQECPDVPHGTVPVSTADLDFPVAPEIREGLTHYLTHGVLGYTSASGAFRDAVVQWCARRHAWGIEAEWIETMPGVVPGLYAAIRALTNPGESVLLPTPAYPPMFDAIRDTARVVEPVHLLYADGCFTFNVSAMEEAARKPEVTALLICSPHNPTGRVWRREELRELARIARENDLAVISDEIHWDLVQPAFTHTPFPAVSEDALQRTILLSAASKSFNIAGLTTSFAIIANRDLRARYVAELKSWGYSFPSAMGLKATEVAFTHAEPWLDALLEHVAHNDALSREFFAEHFPELVIAPLEGTFLQWIDFRPLGLPPQVFAVKNRHEAHVFFDAGSRFGCSGFERLNLGVPEIVLRDLLERLAKAYGR